MSFDPRFDRFDPRFDRQQEILREVIRKFLGIRIVPPPGDVRFSCPEEDFEFITELPDAKGADAIEQLRSQGVVPSKTTTYVLRPEAVLAQRGGQTTGRRVINGASLLGIVLYSQRRRCLGALLEHEGRDVSVWVQREWKLPLERVGLADFAREVGRTEFLEASPEWAAMQRWGVLREAWVGAVAAAGLRR